jgi:transcriptional regulator with XRE-family HTH domain
MKEKVNTRKKRQQHPIDEGDILGGTSIDLMDKEKATRLKFALRFNKLLDDRSITQLEFAKIIKVSTGSISKYRNGLGEPSITVLTSMARALDVSIDYLAGLSEIESPKLDDIAINKILGLSDGAITALKQMKQNAELPVFGSKRLEALNYLLEQEEEPASATPKDQSQLDEYEEYMQEWADTRITFLSDVLDALTIVPNAGSRHTITLDGIKNTKDISTSLLNSVTSKIESFDDEIIMTIYAKRITGKLQDLKTRYKSKSGGINLK